MKVLLIGKNGQLGQELHSQAILRKYTLIAYSHRELDITNLNVVEKKIKNLKPDIVINASAFHVVPDCEIYPDKAFLVNAISVRNLAQVCNELNIKFITYSTDYVFNGQKGSPYIESDLPTPLQAYGISKVAGEYMALAYNKRSIVIRSSGVYGGKKGSRSKKGNFVINILKEKEKMTLEVSSEQIVNPTYAYDLAIASFELLDRNEASGIFHLANEGYCSWAEFASEIMRLTGNKMKIIPTDRSGQSGGARRPLFSALKNDRAKKMGIVLPSWENGLKRYLEFYNF